jgi:hypothetical protein
MASREELAAQLEAMNTSLADAEHRAKQMEDRMQKAQLETKALAIDQAKYLLREEGRQAAKEDQAPVFEELGKLVHGLSTSGAFNKNTVVLSSNRRLDRFRDFIMDYLARKARQEILGRGSSVANDPDEVLRILVQTFGDGDTLPQLLQRFFAFKQEKQDLISVSLQLVELLERIYAVNPSFGKNRDKLLKDRLAEAVADEGLQRELRRLNMERDELTFFYLRDRAIKWLGSSATGAASSIRVPVAEEVVTDTKSLLEELKRMKGDIVKEVIDYLKGSDVWRERVSASAPRQTGGCWSCGDLDHFRRDCPKRQHSGQASRNWTPTSAKPADSKGPIASARKESVSASVCESIFTRAVGKCPEAVVRINGVDVKCLLDTGAQVSTVTESCFRENFACELQDVSKFIRITAANGLNIPYCGYFEGTVTVLGKDFEHIGLLVVKDPDDESFSDRKRMVPGVLGSNALKLMQEGDSNFDGDSAEEGIWRNVMSLYQEEVQVTNSYEGVVRLGMKKSVKIPARSVKQIDCSVKQPRKGQVMQAMVERIDGLAKHLPVGLAVGRTLVEVNEKGHVPVQVAIFGDKDLFLAPKSKLYGR